MGRGSPPKIEGGAVLKFKMEILEIMGDTTLAISCNPKTKDDCDEKEVKYIDKIQKWDNAKIKSELERMDKLMGTSMKEELAIWIRKRRSILEQMGDDGEEEEL